VSTGIVGVLDAGVAEDGRYFLVLRYVEGPTLRELLAAKRALAQPFVKKLAAQLAEALGMAHRLGVLHLDLKPENIVIRDQGRPEEQAIILDFGVGALLSGPADRSFIRTASPYQAPELADGERSEKSDLYSVGAILFESLTATRFENQNLGRVPGSRASALQDHRRTQPKALDGGSDQRRF
jgi:serine/threonine protein kinase